MTEIRDPYVQKCEELGISHMHCPYSCEHPQPVQLDDGRLVCGRCWAYGGVAVEMVPCTPDNCD